MAPITSQQVHRPGSLKQTNKPHKSGKSKGRRHDKGKLDVKAVTHRKRQEMNRTQRKNQMQQFRKTKREEVLKQKRKLGGLKSAPILVMILPLDDSISAVEFLEKLQSCDEDLIITESAMGHSHISCSRFKQRYTFVIPNKFDLHSVMDALKVCEILLLLHSSSPLDDYTDTLLSVIMAHALPTTIHVAQGLSQMNPKKKAEHCKHIQKALESRFPDVKLHQADTSQELQLLLRQIGNQKQRTVGFRDNRPHMLVEDMSFELEHPESTTGTLAVKGFIRGERLNVNGLVVLPGWGTYRMSQIYHPHVDPHSSEKFHLLLETTETANPDEQESLQSEMIPDPMEGEQTWPTQEELDEAESKPKKKVKKVVEGTSEYQAAWIVESEDDESDPSDADSQDGGEMLSDNQSEKEMEAEMETAESASEVIDENYDENIDMNEERQTLVRFKEERLNQMFPDEQDTPQHMEARKRYQKYRGLKSFYKDQWDPMENLPPDYGRIFRFQNFKQTKKNVLSSEKEGAEPGEYVTVYITDVPQSLYDSVRAEKSLLIVYGLLRHEQKMSVVNASIRKHPFCKVPIKSKDTLIFHVGFRRFTCKPIFSEHKTGNKFKFERFLPSDTAVVASFYAPVTFPPASVTVFRQRPNGSHELVATGSVLDVNPNRIVVKRIILSGHPFRIFKKSAVVRFMFFNREDINYFKSIELHTKYGRKGHIRDTLGSHGHMKCVFDQQLQSQDVVLMNLYKRVYPKWTYDDYVPTPVYNTSQKVSSVETVMDTTS